MSLRIWIERAVRPLASRKVRVALATVLAAYAVEYGLAWSEELVLTVVSVGVALILGIAHEDAGRASGSGPAPAKAGPAPAKAGVRACPRESGACPRESGGSGSGEEGGVS